MDEITITIPVFYVHVGFWLFIVWCALGIAQSALDMLSMYYQRKLERAKKVSDEFAKALMDGGRTRPYGGAPRNYPHGGNVLSNELKKCISEFKSYGK
jgi:hypothetical protein